MNDIEEYFNKITDLKNQIAELNIKLEETKLKAYESGLFTIMLSDLPLEYLKLYNLAHNTSYVFTNIDVEIAYYDNGGPCGDYAGYYSVSFDRRTVEKANCKTVYDLMELAKHDEHVAWQLKHGLLHLKCEVKDSKTQAKLEHYNLPRDFKYEFDLPLDFKAKFADGNTLADKIRLHPYTNSLKLTDGINQLTYNINIEDKELKKDQILGQAVINCATKFKGSGIEIPSPKSIKPDGMPK